MRFKSEVQALLTNDRGGVQMKKKSRIRAEVIIVVLGLSVTAAVLGGCRTQSEINAKGIEELPEIVIGSDDYPPFNYVDENGQPTGIDVDLAKKHLEEWDIRLYSNRSTGRKREHC